MNICKFSSSQLPGSPVFIHREWRTGRGLGRTSLEAALVIMLAYFLPPPTPHCSQHFTEFICTYCRGCCHADVFILIVIYQVFIFALSQYLCKHKALLYSALLLKLSPFLFTDPNVSLEISQYSFSFLLLRFLDWYKLYTRKLDGKPQQDVNRGQVSREINE